MFVKADACYVKFQETEIKTAHVSANGNMDSKAHKHRERNNPWNMLVLSQA